MLILGAGIAVLQKGLTLTRPIYEIHAQHRADVVDQRTGHDDRNGWSRSRNQRSRSTGITGHVAPEYPIREAVNKSSPSYKGNNNKRNVQFVSDAARPFLTSQGQTVSEHIIPISVLLNSKIYAREEPTIDTEGLIQLVAQYSTMVLITNEEDARLRQAKLQSSMPEDWDGVHMFARYKAIGIVVSPIT